MIPFADLHVMANFGIFLAACAVVWWAGSKVTDYANAISYKTGIGQAAIGLLLLGGITSLPEIGAVTTSAATGAADLAISNLFGSIAAQVVVLAGVDALIGRRALTSSIPDPEVILQGGLNVLLLSIVTAGMVVGDYPIVGIGAWGWVSLGAYVFSVWLLSESQGNKSWVAARHGKVDAGVEEQAETAQEKAHERFEHMDLRPLIWKTAGLAGVILVAGYLLSQTADAIAEQTGIGGSVIGFVLLAIATSLPEISTTVTAARQGLYTLAVSDILGTNLINVGLIFIVDAVSGWEAVLNDTTDFDIFGALLGIAVTSLFIIGMAERRNRTVLRMGLDSVAVMACYVIGVLILFTLNPGSGG